MVTGTIEWFNVRYNGEEEVLTLNLYTDIDNGDLDIVGVHYLSAWSLFSRVLMCTQLYNNINFCLYVLPK